MILDTFSYQKMASKKRHHYIPRFYLKRFSVNNEGKFIGLYNHESDVFVQEAPLRHQAYQNFLYGEDDDIENALAEMESNVAKMFYYWTEEKLLYPPSPETNGFNLLKRFVLYQAFRTPKSGNDLMQLLNDGLNTVLKEFKPDLLKQMEAGTLAHKNPVLFSLFNSLKHENLLNYLDCKFIVNLSELPLITSDAPVIFYNQLMEAAGNYTAATSLVAKGLQIFYPIHPRLIVCFYDSKVYDLGNGCINCCSTESIDEIHQLNALQFINSKNQIFFDDIISETYIKKLCKQYDEYRKEPRNVNAFVDSGPRKFLFTGTKDPNINLNLHFFKMLVNPKDYENMICPLRHPSFRRPPIKKISFDD
jgi:hypothetical protein